MIRALLLLVGLTLAGVAQAQVKCWTGADGKRGCGDIPPPGARLDVPKGAPAPAPAPAAKPEPKKTAPIYTPLDQEVRAPQGEPRKTGAMTMKKAVPTGSQRDCERAQEALNAMGGGGRSKRTDAVKARALAENNCPR